MGAWRIEGVVARGYCTLGLFTRRIEVNPATMSSKITQRGVITRQA